MTKLQNEVTSPMKMEEQNFKQKGKTICSEVNKELFLVHPSSTQMIGQKRKQVKVYRPKSQVLNSQEKMRQGTDGLTLTLGEQNTSTRCPPSVTLPIGDEALSYKK